MSDTLLQQAAIGQELGECIKFHDRRIKKLEKEIKDGRGDATTQARISFHREQVNLCEKRKTQVEAALIGEASKSSTLSRPGENPYIPGLNYKHSLQRNEAAPEFGSSSSGVGHNDTMGGGGWGCSYSERGVRSQGQGTIGGGIKNLTTPTSTTTNGH